MAQQSPRRPAGRDAGPPRLGVRSGVLGNPPAGKARSHMGHRHAQIAATRDARASGRHRDAALLSRPALNPRAERNHGAVDTVMAGMRARNVLMVYPRFVADSFFNFRAACEAIGRRSAAAPLGLITVAALLPPEWSMRFLDRNVEELTERDLAWADLVMTGGMIVQQNDTLDITRMCRARGIPVAVGGPDATSK